MRRTGISLLIWIALAHTVVGQGIFTNSDSDNPMVVLNSGVIQQGNIRDTLFNPRVSDKSGNRKNGMGYSPTTGSAAVFVLMNTPQLNDAYPNGYELEVTLVVRFQQVSSFSNNSQPTFADQAIDLNIEYSPNGGEYKNKDTYVLQNVWWADFAIRSVRLKSILGEKVILDGNPFQLYAFLTNKGFVPFNTTQKPSLNARVHANKGYLLLDWPEVPGATAYDLEWTFEDGYGGNTSFALDYNFRHNATRVSTNKLNYEIPLVFEMGALLFRIRAVSGSTTGEWTLPDKGQISMYSPFLQELLKQGLLPIPRSLAFEQDLMNWQYVAQFAENGKRKDVVSVMDGTFRNRQTITRLNTGSKHLLVGETIYDHQGRPAIQVLPAPLAASESPALRYQPAFSQNQQGQAYSRRDFDLDDNSSAYAQPKAAPMSTRSGAAQYYSPDNPNQQGINAYIPNAQWFPFIQVEYTPDNTGRIQRQGGVGPDFQLGGQQEKKFTYGNPTQFEIDRLFGSDAGEARFYQKEKMRDENGQWYVTYKNMAGQTVASALTGTAPANLEAVPKNPNDIFINRADLVAENRNQAPADGVLFFSKNIDIAVDSTPFTVNFSLAQTNFFTHASSCPNQQLCYDCVYDLEILLMQDNGRIWLRHSITGNLNQLQGCDGTTLPALQNKQISLAAGSYTLSHRLRVNEQALEAMVDDVMLRDTCWKPAIKAIETVIPCEDTPCIPCQFEVVDVSLMGNVPAKVLRRTPMNNPNCRVFCPDEATLQTHNTALDYHLSKWEELLRDVSPMGQYGQYDITENGFNAQLYDFSIFNQQNALSGLGGVTIPGAWSYRNPAFPYRNADGSESWIDVTDDPYAVFDNRQTDTIDNRVFIRPENIWGLSLFIKHWQASWAESLVPYHPEYAYFEWSRANQAIIQHDSLIQATTTMAAAIGQNMIRFGNPNKEWLLNTIASNDPLFDGTRQGDQAAFVKDLLQVGTIGIVGRQQPASIDIFDVMISGIHCAGPEYGLENDQQGNSIQEDQYNNLLACIGEIPLGNIPTEHRDQAWEIFKALYRAARARVLDKIRTREVASLRPQRSNSNCIGQAEEACLCTIQGELRDLLVTKMRRFNRDACANTRRTPSEREIAGNRRLFGETTEAMLQRNPPWEKKQTCGTCPIGNDLLMLLNGLAYEKKLTESEIEIGRTAPILISRELSATFFYFPREAKYNWILRHASSGQLNASLYVQETEVFRFSLTAARGNIAWDSLRFFACIRLEKDRYIIEAYDDQEKGVELYFDSPNLNDPLRNCNLPDPIYPTSQTQNWSRLLNFLIKDRNYLNGQAAPGRALPIPEAVAVYDRRPNTNNRTISWRTVGEVKPFDYNLKGKLYFSKNDICELNFEFDKNVASATRIISVENIRAFEVNGVVDTLKFKADAILSGAELPKGTIIIAIALCKNKINPFTKRPPRPLPPCCPPAPFPRIIPAKPCTEQLQIVVDNNVRARILAREAQMRNELRLRYRRHCMSGLQETFTAEWEESIYQATLFYYDRAGNLVKTVPPKGVQALSGPQLSDVQANRDNNYAAASRVFPAHKSQPSGMASKYRYNSLNETILKYSPDGGTTRYCYDELGRIIMSQDDEQKKALSQAYLLYDALGRVKESGVSYNYNRPLPTKIRYREYSNANIPQNWFVNSREVVTTVYDRNNNTAFDALFSNGKQEQLRGRIARVTYRAGISGDYDHATHYTYDVLGNVKELVQDFKKLSRDFPRLAGHSTKLVQYDYDLVTGNVNRIIYQPGKQDQFVHWYEYDADNRLTDVYTGLNPLETPMFRHRDAHYEYYLHGPLARVVLGHDPVQGLDYAYTLQGWLKSVNSPMLSQTNDPGRDGTPAAPGRFVPADVFGFGLQYYAGDYSPIRRNAPLPVSADIPPLNSQTRNLWNGNISAGICGLKNLPDPTLVTTYRYDQLNRLTLSLPFRNTASTGWSSNSWEMALNYDLNGNIRYLLRKNDKGEVIDGLNYQYRDPNNNRLSDITDMAGKFYTAPDAPVQDLPTQFANNYQYDLKGRLIADAAQNATLLSWNNQDKLLSYRQLKPGTNQFEYTNFDYDALGRRAFRRTGNRATYTVRDAKGNPLAEYNISGDSIIWTSVPVYGASRLGVYQPNRLLYASNMSTDPYLAPAWRGKRRYELTSHTGDVLALVSDCRLAVTENDVTYTTADVRSMQDYYPFGMPMPGRSYTAAGEGGYRYGFQGMEKENGMKGAGNGYTTEFREYDARVGRWLSVDPKAEKFSSFSTYVAFLNNPVLLNDPKGDVPPQIVFTLPPQLPEPRELPQFVITAGRTRPRVNMHFVVRDVHGRSDNPELVGGSVRIEVVRRDNETVSIYTVPVERQGQAEIDNVVVDSDTDIRLTVIDRNGNNLAVGEASIPNTNGNDVRVEARIIPEEFTFWRHYDKVENLNRHEREQNEQDAYRLRDRVSATARVSGGVPGYTADVAGTIEAERDRSENTTDRDVQGRTRFLGDESGRETRTPQNRGGLSISVDRRRSSNR